MEDRKSLWWACSLMLCAGCLTTGTTKTPPAASSMPAAAAAANVPNDGNVKKDPKRTPRVLVAFAKLKEGEAKTLDREPERQFKMRYEARDLYHDALKMDPSCIEAHRGLGRIYVEVADFDRAQETFKKAQAKFPKESIFWYELGQMHNRKRDFTGAVQCLRKALDMDPENRLYLTTLGLTLARSGQTEQAIALLSRSMGAASAHYNVARMLLHLQRNEEGMQHLRQAVYANPNLQDARQLLTDLENGGPVNVRIDFQAGE